MRHFTDDQSITGEYLTVEQRAAVMQRRTQRFIAEHGDELAKITDELSRKTVLDDLPYGYRRAEKLLRKQLHRQEFFERYAYYVDRLDETQQKVLFDALHTKGEKTAVYWLRVMVGEPTGHADGRRKLTEQQAADIRRRRTSGEKLATLASEFGCVEDAGVASLP